MVELTQRRRSVLTCLCLALTTAAVYWPVRHFEFTNYDDGDYVYQNPQVQSGLTWRGLVWAFTTNHSNNWHPLTWLSHQLDWQLWGGNAGAHHLVNVLLHIANALLLFGVLNQMTRAPWRSGFVAALFALHPLHVESVAWVAERKDVLSTFFWMLTTWAYVRYVEQPARTRYLLTLGLFVLGLMAKPMMVTLPFVLLLLDYWPLGRTHWVKSVIRERAETPLGHLVKEKLPFLALTVVSCGMTFWAQSMGGAVETLEGLPIGDRVTNAVVSYVRYLGKVFWPDGLAVFYPYENWTFEFIGLASAILVGISIWTIWRARREPQFLVGWLWYLGVLCPVIGLVQVGSQSMADRYTYLPLIGLFMMLAWSVPSSGSEQRRSNSVMATTAIVLLFLCSVLSRFQLCYWKNSETLFRHALEVTRNNWVAHNYLGLALAAGGKVPEAIAQYEQALRSQPSAAEIYYNLALVLTQANRVQETIEHLQQAVRLKPNFVDAHNNLAIALILSGKTQEAVSYWEQAVRLKPNDAEVHYNLANALLALGKVPEAEGHWVQALQVKPDFAEAHNALGLALIQEGKIRDAIGHYERALRITPDYAEALNNLARVLATVLPVDSGDPIRAVVLAKRACELTGNRLPLYLDTLATAYASAGRFKDAVATAQKAIEFAHSAGRPEVAAEIESRLKMYREGIAYRQISPPRP